MGIENLRRMKRSLYYGVAALVCVLRISVEGLNAVNERASLWLDMTAKSCMAGCDCCFSVEVVIFAYCI